MFTVALLVRLGYIAIAHAYIIPMDYYFRVGYETGAVAAAMSQGNGFSSPFFNSPGAVGTDGLTGPTAWLGPIYPSLLALLFKIFGAYSEPAAFLILAFNSLCSALVCLTLVAIGKRTVGLDAGFVAAWIWALAPNAVYWPAVWIWEVTLSALLLSCAFLLSLKFAQEGETRMKAWAGFGALWGFSALTNPALLTFLPFSGLYAAMVLRGKKLPWFRQATLSAIVFFAVISPWIVRNYVAFGHLVLIRQNFPFEFRLGNFRGATGMGWGGLHPSVHQGMYRQYRELGEREFIEFYKRENAKFVREHPEEFWTLTWTRFKAFWDGTWLDYVTPDPTLRYIYFSFSMATLVGLFFAFREKIPGAWLFASLIFYPVPYYLTFPQVRYRHPIEPEMLLLVVFGVMALTKVSHFTRKASGG